MTELATENKAGVLSPETLASLGAPPIPPEPSPGQIAQEKADKREEVNEAAREADAINEASMLLNALADAWRPTDTPDLAHTKKKFLDEAYRAQLAAAIARVMLFYDLSGPAVMAHPLVGLLLASIGLVGAGFMDWKIYQAKKLDQVKTEPPPPAAAPPVTQQAFGPKPPPPNGLAELA